MKLFAWMTPRKQRRVVLFEAGVGMTRADMERVLAGKAKHPVAVAANQLLADQMVDSLTIACDPKIQSDTHRVAHALGEVNACSLLRAQLAELTNAEGEE